MEPKQWDGVSGTNVLEHNKEEPELKNSSLRNTEVRSRSMSPFRACAGFVTTRNSEDGKLLREGEESG